VGACVVRRLQLSRKECDPGSFTVHKWNHPYYVLLLSWRIPLLELGNFGKQLGAVKVHLVAANLPCAFQLHQAYAYDF
jgi:hypothetical protein